MILLRELLQVDLRADGRRVREEDWTEKSRVHNWRNYVDEEIRHAWTLLSDEARGLAYVIAEMEASQEEWD